MSDPSTTINQLRATLSKMEIALSTVEDGIAWTDSYGKIRWCNTAFERFLDAPRLFLLGASLSDKLPLCLNKSLVKTNNHPVEIALKTKENGKQDYEFERQGKIILLEVAWNFVEITNDLAIGDDFESAVLVLREVTQQRHAARKQQKINKLLEKQVAQRTEELSDMNGLLQQEANRLQQLLSDLRTTQARLVQAEKMAGLGQLVAGIAHEINNPINFVHGNLEYVQEHTDNLLELVKVYQQCYPQPNAQVEAKVKDVELDFLQGDLPKLLNSMKLGTSRIRDTVLSLRNFSRMDEADLKTVDIHEGIDSTLLMLQHRLTERPASRTIEVLRKFGTLPLIECYAGQLNQAFMSILTNAIDAIDDRQAKPAVNQNEPIINRITIETTMIDPQWAQITIADNGLGMPEAVKQQIYNPFFTTKPVGQGTGMGMAISYQIIVEQHGGQLECESKAGIGTTFTIQIPIKRSIKTRSEAPS